MCRKRDCYADEHYVPVLLATLGLDNETTCNGNTVHVSWQSGTGAGSPCLLLLEACGGPFPTWMIAQSGAMNRHTSLLSAEHRIAGWLW